MYVMLFIFFLFMLLLIIKSQALKKNVIKGRYKKYSSIINNYVENNESLQIKKLEKLNEMECFYIDNIIKYIKYNFQALILQKWIESPNKLLFYVDDKKYNVNNKYYTIIEKYYSNVCFITNSLLLNNESVEYNFIFKINEIILNQACTYNRQTFFIFNNKFVARMYYDYDKNIYYISTNNESKIIKIYIKLKNFDYYTIEEKDENYIYVIGSVYKDKYRIKKINGFDFNFCGNICEFTIFENSMIMIEKLEESAIFNKFLFSKELNDIFFSYVNCNGFSLLKHANIQEQFLNKIGIYLFGTHISIKKIAIDIDFEICYLNYKIKFEKKGNGDVSFKILNREIKGMRKCDLSKMKNNLLIIYF